MCGIFGRVAKKGDALPIILDGLRVLEKRGYDSAGIVVAGTCVRAVGEVSCLVEKLKSMGLSGSVGMGHTRWATHGGKTETNAHPQQGCKKTGAKKIFVVHNGTISNWATLKNTLKKQGHVFASETDTEVIAHLIEDTYAKKKGDFAGAVRDGLRKLRGTYGLVVWHEDFPDQLIAATNFSPLCLGIGAGEYFVASDPDTFTKHTREAIMLSDGDIAILTPDAHVITSAGNGVNNHVVLTIDAEIAKHEYDKGAYATFMEKEIYEQPKTAREAMRGRCDVAEGRAVLGGLTNRDHVGKKLAQYERVIFTGMGTAFFAGELACWMVEKYAPTVLCEALSANHLMHRNGALRPGKDALFAFSQSGETADTRLALREASLHGVEVYGIVNKVGSVIARENNGGVYLNAGMEVGVASTKALTGMLVVAYLLAILLGRMRGLSRDAGMQALRELEEVPDIITKTLKLNKKIQAIAQKYYTRDSCYFLGSGMYASVAGEGALKLKELTRVHAEGLNGLQMKHGYISRFGIEDFYAVCIVPQGSTYDEMINSIHEIQSRANPDLPIGHRGAEIFAIGTAGDKRLAKMADDFVGVPKVHNELLNIFSLIVVEQLFALHCATFRGANIDKPVNLAKTVTV